jgi:hypothetical protein
MNIVEKYKSPRYASTLKVGEFVKLMKNVDGYSSGEGYGDIGSLYSVYKIIECDYCDCDDKHECSTWKSKIFINLNTGLAWGCCHGTELEDESGRPIIYGTP